MAIHVPTLEYRPANTRTEGRFDPYVVGILSAGVLISTLVWALAIAKLIDLCATH